MALTLFMFVFFGFASAAIYVSVPRETKERLGILVPLMPATISLLAYTVVPISDILFFYDPQNATGDLFYHGVAAGGAKILNHWATVGLVLALLTFFSFYWVAYHIFFSRSNFIAATGKLFLVDVNSKSFWALCLLVYGIGALGYYLAIVGAGGWESYMGTHWAQRSEFTSSAMFYLRRLFFISGAVLLSGVFLAPSRGLRIICSVAAAFGFLAALLDGVRTPLIEILFFGVIAARAKTRTSRYYLIFGAAVLSLIVALPHARSSFHLSQASAWDRIDGEISAYSPDNLLRRNGEIFHSFALYVRQVDLRPSRKPYLMGETLMKIFVFWIPRSLWPEKPHTYHVIVGEDENMPVGVSLAPGLHAEGYSNFGAPGIVLVMAYAGILIAFFQSYAVWLSRQSREVFLSGIPGLGLMMGYSMMMFRFGLSDCFLRYAIPSGLFLLLYWMFFQRRIVRQTRDYSI